MGEKIKKMLNTSRVDVMHVPSCFQSKVFFEKICLSAFEGRLFFRLCSRKKILTRFRDFFQPSSFSSFLWQFSRRKNPKRAWKSPGRKSILTFWAKIHPKIAWNSFSNFWGRGERDEKMRTSPAKCDMEKWPCVLVPIYTRKKNFSRKHENSSFLKNIILDENLRKPEMPSLEAVIHNVKRVFRKQGSLR